MFPPKIPYVAGKGNVFEWSFDTSNPVSNAFFDAIHDHVESPLGAVKDNKPWNPNKIWAGSLSDKFLNQDSFAYTEQNGIRSLLLDDDNCDCLSTISLGSGMCGGGGGGGGSSTTYVPPKIFGIDNLDDPLCDTPKPSNSLSLYYAWVSRKIKT